MRSSRPPSRRGRPRGNYARYIGFEGPLGLRVESIVDEPSRAHTGPRVVAVCTLCGEHSTPRLRDLLSGHSKSGGCRKRRCFIEYCDRVVSRMDQSVVEEVWAARYQNMTRRAAASEKNLPYAIVDAAQRAYEAKLNRMIEEGAADKLYERVHESGCDVETAARQFRLCPAAGRYLFLAGFNHSRQSRSPDSSTAQLEPCGKDHGTATEHDEAWWCAYICNTLVEEIRKRHDWSVACPGELAKAELKWSKGRLVGDMVQVYEEANRYLKDVNVAPELKEDMRAFVDLANATLDDRRERQRRFARGVSKNKDGASRKVEARMDSID